jgi:hypothetical protein
MSGKRKQIAISESLPLSCPAQKRLRIKSLKRRRRAARKTAGWRRRSPGTRDIAGSEGRGEKDI